MASDFAPVQPTYLNLGQILGQAEDIKTSRMQQQYLAARARSEAAEAGSIDAVRQLYAGGRKPTYEELMSASPEFAQTAQKQGIDRTNADSIKAEKRHALLKQTAAGMAQQWDAIDERQKTPELFKQLALAGKKQVSMADPELADKFDVDNIDLNAMYMLAAQAGYKSPKLQAQAEGLKAEAQARAKFPYEVAQDRAKPPKPAPAPRPPSEIDKQRLADMQSKNAAAKAKLEADKDDAIANIDDTIAEFTRLKDLQDKTTTGPVAGSAPIAWMREAGPNSITGGDNLALLEKGYNTLAVKAIAAFKAGGVTFGQLSNKEGDWVKSTSATINSRGSVNKDVLDEGLRLLQQRKQRIMKHYEGSKQTAAPSGGLGSYTDEDLQYTASKYGLSVDEARQKLEEKLREMQGQQ